MCIDLSKEENMKISVSYVNVPQKVTTVVDILIVA